MLPALLGAMSSIGGAAAGAPSSASLEANGNVYGGINFGDAALNNKAMPAFLANRLTGAPQQKTLTSDLDPLKAVALGGALVLTFLLLKRMA